MPLSMALIKVLTTVGIVLALSLVAERAGPRMAGILSGYPLGVALTLFFIGIEISPDYAAQSAVFAIAGLCATQAFVFVYYLVSRKMNKGGIAVSTLAATAAYLCAAAALRPIPFTRAGALFAAFASMGLFTLLFRRIPDVRIARSVRFTPAVFALRALLAAFILLAVTAAAHAVGPAWAGLFSAFPIAVYPLLLIVHLTYDKAHVHTIIKHFPRGMGAIAVYALCVSWVYPAWGVARGTAAAFAVATVYLGAFVVLASRGRRG